MSINSHSVTATLHKSSQKPTFTAHDVDLWKKRMSDEEVRSAKRLKSIRANNLAPSGNITNYTKAFQEHALAIGLVGGSRKAIMDAKGSLTTGHGPQLKGLTYSEDYLRFHTPHTMLTYISGSHYGNSGNSKVMIQANTIPDAPYAVKLFSGESGLDAVGGKATRTNPATRVLAFDFDQKQHDEQFVKDEVIATCQILHDAGMYNWIVDVSSAGYHVLLMLNRPVLLSDVTPFFEGIKLAFKSLDVQPMTFSGGAISVPFSKVKSSSIYRLLAHSRNSSFVQQRRANRATEWDNISERLLEGIKEYDRFHLRGMHFDQEAVKVADKAMEQWLRSVSVRHSAKKVQGDHLFFEQRHLNNMVGRDYPSASEERFSIAGAMVDIYGFSEDALERAAARLKTSDDPMPRRYRELIKNSSGRVSLNNAARKDLISARDKSWRPRGWVGSLNGSSHAKIASNKDMEFTPATNGLVRKLIVSMEQNKESFDYTEIAILRAYIQFANARHHEYLDAVERGDEELPEDPFATSVPFALSMVTRLTGLPHGTAYSRTMSCSAGLKGATQECIPDCREAGQKTGLFCECHPQWGPFFEVSHFGHAGENDEGNRADMCRDHSYCTVDGCEGKTRTSTFVKFHSYPETELTEEQTGTWLYQYLVSRDPIFNESALGAAGFHFHSAINNVGQKVFNDDLQDIKLSGTAVKPVVDELIAAGLVGRNSRRGKNAFLLKNKVEDASLAYRLRHERRLHAADQNVGFKSAMMGTGDITQFVLGFSHDLPRMFALVRDVINFVSGNDEHEPATLKDKDGNSLYSVEEFCHAYDFPEPPAHDGASFKRGLISSSDCDIARQRGKHGFAYVHDETEVKEFPEQLFDEVHHRDDFLDTAAQLRSFENYLFGSEFTPSQILTDLFIKRREDFISKQELLAEMMQKGTV